MTATGKCQFKLSDGEICRKPTNKSFPYGNKPFNFYCEEHEEDLFEQVTGNKPKKKKPTSRICKNK